MTARLTATVKSARYDILGSQKGGSSMRLMCLTLFVALTAMAQVDPEYVVPKKNPFATAADLKNGQQLFMGQCARCHGPKGEGGRGAVLAQPRLRHAPDDESLFLVIRDGIKGTEMPGGYALGYSRDLAACGVCSQSGAHGSRDRLPGDPKRGQEVYRTKGRCAQCHISGGLGGSLGPELTEIGARRSAAHLRAAVLDPASTLPEGFLEVRRLRRMADASRACGSTKTSSASRSAI